MSAVLWDGDRSRATHQGRARCVGTTTVAASVRCGNRCALPRLCGLAIALAVLLSSSGARAGLVDEPTHPVCVPMSGLAWCSMVRACPSAGPPRRCLPTACCGALVQVSYTAVVNASDVDGGAADLDARRMSDQVLRMLSRFDCSSRYGYFNCTDCEDAYKYWACATKFPRCGPNGNHRSALRVAAAEHQAALRGAERRCNAQHLCMPRCAG